MHSHAEAAALPCRACGKMFECEVWIIVATAERPDLLARMRAGTLHELTCPHCGRADTLNAPLLVYRPGAEPPLLFSPARGGSREQDEEQAMALLGMFREGLGGEWRDEWLAQGLAGVAREALPALLDDDPTTAAALAAAVAAGQDPDNVPSLLRRALEEILTTLAVEGVRVETAEDLGRALEARPELKDRLAAVLKNDQT